MICAVMFVQKDAADSDQKKTVDRWSLKMIMSSFDLTPHAVMPIVYFHLKTHTFVNRIIFKKH